MDLPDTTSSLPRDHLRPVLKLLRRVLRAWWLGVIVAAAATVVIAAVLVLLPKTYRSEALVYYREGLQWNNTEAANTRRVGQRLRDMLLSRAQLTKMIEQMGLYPELVRKGRIGDAVEEMRLATRFDFDQGDIFVVGFTGSSPEEAQRVTAKYCEVLIGENSRFRSQQAVVAREFLDAEKKRLSDELAQREGDQLRFLAQHPEFAQENQTPGVTLRARSADAAAVAAARSTDPALAALRREEERLQRQIQNPGQIPAPPPDPAVAAARAEAEAQVAAAHRELADRRMRFTEEHPDVRMALSTLKEAEANLKRAAEALAVKPAPVPVAELQERLAQVRRDIAAHRREAQPRAASDQIRNSEAALRIVAVETEWVRLGREVNEARARVEQLDSQQFVAAMTASMVSSGQSAQMMVVDPAYLPTKPTGLSDNRVILVAFGLALLIGLGTVVTRAVLDDRIEDEDDLGVLGTGPVLATAMRQSLHEVQPDEETSKPAARGARPAPPDGAPADVRRVTALRRKGNGGPATAEAPAARPIAGPEPVRALAVPPPGPVPLPQREIEIQVHRLGARGEPQPLLVAAPESAAAAAFRVLRHRVAARRGRQVVLVTSAHRGEGKTLTAINLALALAEAGRTRVLLLEANFRTPAVARQLRFQPPACLSQQLELHRARPAAPWSVVENPTHGVHTLAVSPETARTTLLDGRALALCLQDLRQAGYDHIVVDSPAILESADVHLVEELVDGIVLTAWARRSRIVEFRRAIDQIGKDKILGFMLLGA